MAWRCSASSNAGLVEKMRAAGLVNSGEVGDAMLKTDRAFYVAERPYEDSPQVIGFDATISAPHMHAMALEALLPALRRPGPANVLDVGCGSGYFTALLQRTVEGAGGRAFGVDYIPGLVALSRVNIGADDASLLAADNKIALRVGDGWKGWPEHAPFRAIHVGAAAAEVPPALIAQLAPGGRMIVPVGADGGAQELLQIDKSEDGRSCSSTSLTGVRYVPLVKVPEIAATTLPAVPQP